MDVTSVAEERLLFEQWMAEDGELPCSYPASYRLIWMLAVGKKQVTAPQVELFWAWFNARVGRPADYNDDLFDVWLSALAANGMEPSRSDA